jgi:hypothetical protein
MASTSTTVGVIQWLQSISKIETEWKQAYASECKLFAQKQTFSSWSERVRSNFVSTTIKHAMINDKKQWTDTESMIESKYDFLMKNRKESSHTLDTREYLLFAAILAMRKRVMAMKRNKVKESSLIKIAENWLTQILKHTRDIHLLVFCHTYLQYKFTFNHKSLNTLHHRLTIIIHHSPIPFAERLRITSQIYTELLPYYGPKYDSCSPKQKSRHLKESMSYFELHSNDFRTLASENSSMIQTLLHTLIESMIIHSTDDAYIKDAFKWLNHVFPGAVTLGLTDRKKIWTESTCQTIHNRHSACSSEESIIANETNYVLLLLHLFHLLLICFGASANDKSILFHMFRNALLQTVWNSSLCHKSQKELSAWWKDELGQQSSVFPVSELKTRAESSEIDSDSNETDNIQQLKPMTQCDLSQICRLVHLHSLTTLSQIRRCLVLIVSLCCCG